ncbi:universal stress protein [Nocardioides sp. ChNu-153]|uniref:universal stress protein n=1 Tax=unclassified Nocardioides TaxID=2615069 RepID=UPI002406AF6F|nr:MULTISPECIES: universal stress protein [unclassified Nocardioides]MDF9715585.1 universal stress protein [Nocardioides sp. ChNu-99]MDN7121257.1 universal stress protein [Nocardioides sp. ChNu-153]
MTTIVVGYVTKPEGEAALHKAIEEARLREARVVLVSATRGEDTVEGLEPARELLAAAGLPHEVRVTTGAFDPAEDLLAVADELDADLIVIGLRRRTPVGKLLLGSNAQRILLDARTPVLAVKVPAAG